MNNIIIQSVAKDEDHIICEWLIHNIMIGVEHIYLYDDLSLIPIQKKIELLPKDIQSKITIFRLEHDFFNQNDFKNSKFYDAKLYDEKKENKQMYLHNWFLKNYWNVSKWCYFCDVDEFMWLKDEDTIGDFLARYEQYNTIYIPWLMHGTSYNLYNVDGLVMQNYIYHDDVYYKWQGKSIGKLYELAKMSRGIVDGHRLIENVDKMQDKCLILNSAEKLYELPVHINHYVYNNLQTYIRRKTSRKSLGQALGKLQFKPDEILSFPLLFHNTIRDDLNIMTKYINQINQIIPPTTDEKSNNFVYDPTICYSIVKVDNEILLPKNMNYEKLAELSTRKDIRYVTWKEILPNNYTVEKYKDLNPDLRKMTDNEANLHYFFHGKIEGRKF